MTHLSAALRRLLLLLGLAGATLATALAQTPGVGIGTTAPNASAVLDVSSTTKGFLPPRMTQTQRDAIAPAATAAGLIIFNTTTSVINTWDGTKWVASLSDTTPTPVTTNFAYTGGAQTYTVPTGVTSLSVDMAGAAGGLYAGTGQSGSGLGGRVQSTLAVTPGQVLTIYVAGAGAANVAGYNGGGTATGADGGGGGASDIRTGGTALTNRILVAGGGGGGGDYSSGGAGGGLTGANGSNGSAGYGGGGGGGGSQSAAGTGGAAGSGAVGGNGSSNVGGGGNGYSGGGGGGYFGAGGGGGSSGGGGGSSYAGTGTSAVTNTQGYQSANGYVNLSPVATPPTTPPAPYLDGSNISGVIKNQTTQQASANFNISGNGTIGGNSTVTGNEAITGNSTVAGTVGIGTTAPTALLDVAGSTRLRGLTTAGIVTTDASGNLSSSTAAGLDPTTASNGLTKTGSNFALGGALTQATTISGITATNTVELSGTAAPLITNTTAAASTSTRVLGLRGQYLNSIAGSGAHLSFLEGSGYEVGRIASTQDAGVFLIGLSFSTTNGTAGVINERMRISPGGNVGINISAPSALLDVNGSTRLRGLTTAGMVTTDVNGNLSSSTAASLDPTTASNGLTKTGSNFTLGGTLVGATTIAQGGNNFSLTGGNIGVGTTAPFTQFTNSTGTGNVVGTDGNGASSQSINWVSNTNGYVAGFYSGYNGAGGDGVAVKVYNTSATALDITQSTSANTAGTSLLRVNGNGNVGIGTTAPGQRLEVIGGIQVGSYGNFSGTVSDQGAHLQWNRSGGDGETWLINHRGAGNAYAGIRFGGITTSTGTTVTEWARFNNSGNFGIGTTNPIAKLHVNGAVTATDVTNNISYFCQGGGFTQNQANTAGFTRTLSAYFEGGQFWVNSCIVAGAMNVSSDRRIKHIVGLSDRAADLAMLNKIRVTDYTYIDKLANSDKVVKKVIAQEIQALLPVAVTTSTQAIPNVYEKATHVAFAQGRVTVTTAKPHDLPAAGGKMRLYTTTNVNVTADATVVDAHTFSFASDQAYETGLFVYGKFVDDFLSVDYDALAMLNVSATQELARKVALLETQNAALQAGAAAAHAALQVLHGRTAQADADHASLLTMQAQLARLLGADAQARK